MNHTKVLFVSDLDGTLLRSDATLDPADAPELNDLTAHGVQITYATARTIRSVAHILSDLQFRENAPPVALMNGVLLRDMARGVYCDIASFSKETADALLTALSSADTAPFVYALDGDGELWTYYHAIPNTAMQAFMEERIARYQKPFHKINTITEIPGQIIYFCLVGPQSDVRRAEDAIAEIPGIRKTSYPDNYDPSTYYLEIFDERASKRHAIEYLRAVTGADIVICFGDNLNDIPMFEASDIAVAVENAHPELKSRADDIVSDGVCAWIKKYLQTNKKEQQV